MCLCVKPIFQIFHKSRKMVGKKGPLSIKSFFKQNILLLRVEKSVSTEIINDYVFRKRF
jgi:hypothetical protein